MIMHIIFKNNACLQSKPVQQWYGSAITVAFANLIVIMWVLINNSIGNYSNVPTTVLLLCAIVQLSTLIGTRVMLAKCVNVQSNLSTISIVVCIVQIFLYMALVYAQHRPEYVKRMNVYIQQSIADRFARKQALDAQNIKSNTPILTPTNINVEEENETFYDVYETDDDMKNTLKGSLPAENLSVLSRIRGWFGLSTDNDSGNTNQQLATAEPNEPTELNDDSYVLVEPKEAMESTGLGEESTYSIVEPEEAMESTGLGGIESYEFVDRGAAMKSTGLGGKKSYVIVKPGKAMKSTGLGDPNEVPIDISDVFEPPNVSVEPEEPTGVVEEEAPSNISENEEFFDAQED